MIKWWFKIKKWKNIYKLAEKKTVWLIVVVKEIIKKIKKTQKELDKIKLRQQQCCSSLNWILQLSHWFEWRITDSH